MKFGKHKMVAHRDHTDAKQMYRVSFQNGYGASVVRGPHTYGGVSGLWELAVLRDGDLCYDTPVTCDVIGWLKEEDVAPLLDRIEALPAQEEDDRG